MKPKASRKKSHFSKTAKQLLGKLGPGVISGASRNDPCSVTTYAIIGAQVGFSLLWTLLISFPLLAGIQDICARIGRVTGKGIAANLRRFYPAWVLHSILLLLLVANIVNLGADIGMMGEAVSLIIGGPALIYSVVLTLIAVVSQILLPYDRYVSLLKWLVLSLLAYLATAMVIDVNWVSALKGTLIPSVSFSKTYIMATVAAFGATINPYLFFWQASQEVEEQDRQPNEKPLKSAPEQAPKQISRIKLDTYTGMTYSNIVAYFIMLTTAVTMHSNTNSAGTPDSASQIAKALEPVAGNMATILFCTGIIGIGMLAIPVLAGSLAYAVGETLKWPVSLDHEPTKAKGFYGAIGAACLLGLCLNLFGIKPVTALYWTAILNGIIAGPTMVIVMLMTTNRKVMGKETLSLRLRITGWLATAIVFAASISFFISWTR